MKVFIVYSGKGGVGKTTTTSNVAKILAAMGYKVFIVDADVNTPSIPVIFPQSDFSEKINCASMGYTAKNAIYLTDSAVRSYISESINKINTFKPDVVLIDTPPSITDIHINLIDKIKPSGLLIVTQPNALSITDVNRTAMFFKERNVPILGIIENMCPADAPQAEYTWKLLARIPFSPDFNYNTVFENNKEKYTAVVESILDSENVILENKNRQIFDETITVEDVKLLPMRTRTDIKFVNLNTWEYISELIEDLESGMGMHDEFLTYNTTDKLRRLVEPFKSDNEAYFMVTKAPSCVIKLIAGEIGKGTLLVANSYYGVPRIKYQTSQGEVVLFAHEVMPVNNKELILSLEDGYTMTKDGRYMPPKELVEQCYHLYGWRVGLMKDWEETYDNIVEGNMPVINDQQVMNEAVSIISKGKKVRKSQEKNIGDLAYLVRGEHH